MAKVLEINNSHKNNCYIGLIKYSLGAYVYTTLPYGHNYNSFFVSITSIFIKLYRIKSGFTTFLKFFKPQAVFFNLILNLQKGAQYARAAGTYCLLIEFNKEKKTALLELPTKKRK